MLSMLHVKHASNWVFILKCNLSKPGCSLASKTQHVWAHPLRCLATHSKPQSDGRGVSRETEAFVSSNHDGRQRLSAFWAPTGGIEATADAQEDSHSLLIRGGFIRQAHAGIFQLLPLGLRIQEKLEGLLDKHMTRLGASKISLSTLSSQDLWRKSGRISEETGSPPGIFQVQDRKGGEFILSPTHEEEVTTLVGNIVKSYKDLPLKLYQITRKYRDEARPRQGLLRTREFLMKDLYTFDDSPQSALESYHNTRKVYSDFFNEFKIPYLVAKASSGDMGGDLSHEFHFLTSKGEDNIISCKACDYVANEELAEVRRPKGLKRYVMGPYTKMADQEMLIHFASSPRNLESLETHYRQWFGYSLDGQTMVQVIYPSRETLLAAGIEAVEEPQINPSAVQQEFPDLDLSIENPNGNPMKATRIYRIYDATILPPSALHPEMVENTCFWPPDSPTHSLFATTMRRLKKPFFYDTDRQLPVYEVQPGSEERRNLLKIVNGDPCAKCHDGRLRVQKAVELGHTFHLGTRYTKPLKATIAQNPKRKDKSMQFVFEKAGNESAENGEIDEKTRLEIMGKLSPGQTYMQMGCHGIGVSRLIAAAADALVDAKGLNWPRVMAPYEAVVVPASSIDSNAQASVYDALARPAGDLEKAAVDVILDDRQRDFGWKLRDADMIGYPVIVVIGRGWSSDQKCEVQCRRLEFKEQVPLQKLRQVVTDLLNEL